jgi:methyl-accepting chemotaxis protein
VAKLHDIVATIKDRVGQAESLSDNLMASSEESSAAIYQISQNLRSIGEQVSGLDGNVQSTFRSVEGILATVSGLTDAVQIQQTAVDASSSSTEADGCQHPVGVGDHCSQAAEQRRVEAHHYRRR